MKGVCWEFSALLAAAVYLKIMSAVWMGRVRVMTAAAVGWVAVAIDMIEWYRIVRFVCERLNLCLNSLV